MVLDGTRGVREGRSRGHWTPLISQLIDKLKVAEASLEDLQRNGTVRRSRPASPPRAAAQAARCAAPVAVCILATVCRLRFALHCIGCAAPAARRPLRSPRCMLCNALGAGRSNARCMLRAFRLYVAARRLHGLQRVVCR